MLLSLQHNPIPKQILVGELATPKSGTYTIEVTVSIDKSSSSNDCPYQSFSSGASFVPLVFIIFLAATTNMVSKLHTEPSLFLYQNDIISRSNLRYFQVELSLGFGVFVGCCS